MTANRKVALMAASAGVAMFGLAYAAVPLYTLFCQVTGFGGTTQRAEQAPATATEKQIVIRFDANTAPSLPWNFKPAQQTMTVKIGEMALAHYEAMNQSGESITGTAGFNVTPVSAGAYFNKIECFCFTEQTLKPGERVDMPIQYFVDPAILDDPDARGINEITLSYTFYAVEKKSAALQSD